MAQHLSTPAPRFTVGDSARFFGTGKLARRKSPAMVIVAIENGMVTLKGEHNTYVIPASRVTPA